MFHLAPALSRQDVRSGDTVVKTILRFIWKFPASSEMLRETTSASVEHLTREEAPNIKIMLTIRALFILILLVVLLPPSTAEY